MYLSLPQRYSVFGTSQVVCPADTPAGISELIRRMCAPDPADRLSIEQCLASPLFGSGGVVPSPLVVTHGNSTPGDSVPIVDTAPVPDQVSR